MFSVDPNDTPIDWLDSDHVMCLLQVHVRSAAIKRQPRVVISERKEGKKTKVLTLNKYMAMGPSGARCQE
jgi:hypothetical protein